MVAVNYTEVTWERCSNVSISGDILRWNPGGKTYGLLDSYKDAPHRELMAADTDDQLRVFVRKWGPLRHSSTGQDSVAWYRLERDLLLANVRFKQAAAACSRLREAFLRLIELSNGQDTISHLLSWNPPYCQNQKEMTIWCNLASELELENAAIAFFDLFPITAMPRYFAKRVGRRLDIRPSLFINNLIEAIRWMVWQDEFLKQPFYFCKRCRKFFEPEDPRRTTFCDDVCAKRYTDRASWRRRKGKNLRYRGDSE
jgi:hypothetical protein